MVKHTDECFMESLSFGITTQKPESLVLHSLPTHALKLDSISSDWYVRRTRPT